MDTKNVFAAISLSAAVIILYGFFLPLPEEIKKIEERKDNKIINNSDAPNLLKNEKIKNFKK